MNRTMQLLQEFYNERKDWDINNPGRPDTDYLNVAYYLIKNHFTKEPANLYDISLIYDNLVINNEVVNIDNIDEYGGAEAIAKKYNKPVNQIKQALNSGYFYLLNYYNKSDDLQQCFFKFKYGYNVLSFLN